MEKERNITVRDVLKVAPWAYVCPLPRSGGDTVCTLCRPGVLDGSEQAMRKSFARLLEKREKAHARSLRRPYRHEDRFYAMKGFPGDVVLNRNVTSFDELMDMQVAAIVSRGCQGGASHIEVQVVDIYAVDPFSFGDNN